ncbi:pyridoxine/pyridoxamine 5'-phosphate oxidase [Kitasatospora sp. NBC_01266]|uniref:pyridoxine/pyridoxamine 5'-phosphate oxidase n=1 Tax=Kitasatospora sp. NBC_01266 TaxID=2903572 RepID=UPI002E36FAA8|nr:pyridoxal 5'-phosphate synthase [Kitasatospora sp. NBC_01266]
MTSGDVTGGATTGGATTGGDAAGGATTGAGTSGGDRTAEDLAALRDLLVRQPAMARELPGFDPEVAPAGPGELFVGWLLGALRARLPDAQVVTLSTVGLDGAPDARIVVLRDVDPEAGVWWFAGDARSPKGRQLAAVPQAALTWYWPELGRQVRVRGLVAPGPAEAAGEVFRLLSPKSRVAALVGHQSEPLGPAAEFWAAWRTAERQLARQPDLVAAGYTQYALRAREVEFWQGAADRLHLRLAYRRRPDGGWERGARWP